MTVLIVAPPTDDHAPSVASEVRRQGGRVELLDLDAFPERVSLAMSYRDGKRSYALTNCATLDLADVRSIWWRRPGSPAVSSELVRPSHRQFAANESDHALAGLWQCVDAFWINEPKRDEVGHRKPLQLRIAQEAGLSIPDTLITNDPAEARAFIDRFGYRKVIFKSFSATQTEWRETRLLDAAEMAVLDHVRFAPVIFQEYIPAACDLRITVVGQRIFPAAIYSAPAAYQVDFRMEMERARIEATTLPPDVEQALLVLMRKLGLVYGAIDLRLTPDGRYVFLEVNPAGQWQFIEHATGQPIAAELAHCLVAGAAA
jgi:glutathione synthase/RimK-type ligase-like ATP-grasp enzyme